MKRRERAIRRLPLPAKGVAKSVRHSVDPLYVALYRVRTGYQGVLPPSRLRARAGWPRLESYVRGGRSSAEQLEAALARVNLGFADFDCILDFGCGAGRVLPNVGERGKPGAELHGCDVDSEAIEWARSERPQASWSVNGAAPPLPYPDGKFQLVYSISIFTHLAEALQLEWLDDLSRVLRPGGVALLTTHGEQELEEYRSGRVASNTPSCTRRVALHGALAEERFIHEPYTSSVWTSKDFLGTDESFGLAFHSEDYIRDVWGERFEILDILPRALASRQDVVVTRKPKQA